MAGSRGHDLARPRTSGPLLHAGASRFVPLVAHAAWDPVLDELAQTAGGSYLFGPRRSVAYAKNLIGSWFLLHRPPAPLPAVSAGRLRATWIVELMAARIDHDLIAKAASLASAASLARYQHHVPPLDDATAMRPAHPSPTTSSPRRTPGATDNGHPSRRPPGFHRPPEPAPPHRTQPGNDEDPARSSDRTGSRQLPLS